MKEIVQLILLAVIDDVISLTSADFGKTENFCLHQYTKFKHHNILIQKRYIYPICTAARPAINEPRTVLAGMSYLSDHIVFKRCYINNLKTI